MTTLDAVIRLEGIAKVFQLTGCFGKPGLQAEDGVCLSTCYGAVIAQLPENGGEILSVGAAYLCRFFGCIEIIITVGHAEPSLCQLVGHFFAVHIILADLFREEDLYAFLMEACRDPEQVGDGMDTLNAPVILFQGREAQPVDGVGIHAAVP